MDESNSWRWRAMQLRAFASVKHRTIALSLLRICLGGTILVYYAQHVFQREFLWGDNGVVPYSTFREMTQGSLSLYLLFRSPIYHTLIFYVGALVTIAFILGFRTRITSVLFYVFTWSLYTRSWFLLTGGDNLLYLIAFYLMFTECGAYFSVDSLLRRPQNSPGNPFVAMLHNYGLLAIIIQISLLYFTSAFYKSQGHMWQDGTAIYYILRTSEFNLSSFAHYLYDHAWTVTMATWFTVVFQMSWPFLIWNRRAKPFVALGALSLHSMIGYFMGLVWFSFVMMSAELVIFDDAELIRYTSFVRRLATNLQVWLFSLDLAIRFRKPYCADEPIQSKIDPSAL